MSGSGEAVRVVVRCRPMSSSEVGLGLLGSGQACIVRVDSALGTVEITSPDGEKPPKSFTFDSAYGPDAAQQTVYEETAYGLVEAIFEGFSCTVFAYGQTGCGKTHTMTGGRDASSRGVIPRAFEQIFDNISADRDAEFLVGASAARHRRKRRAGWGASSRDEGG